MKTTLKRLGDGDYKLYNTDGSCMATTKESPYKKLSVKNCDEMFGVIDVEKLAFEHSNDLGGRCSNRAYKSFKEGFNKAMELNKDKLFTADDIKKAYRAGFKQRNKAEANACKNLIESLQQPTEIEVEIEMVCPHPSDTYRCGLEFGCDEDGCNNPNQIPYLDKNGCLILRKI